MNPHVRLAPLAADLRAGIIDTESRERLARTLERIASGKDATTALDLKRRPGQSMWTRRFRECLDTIARELG